MAEVTLGEDFAGRKLGELRSDLPNSAPVTYYLPCPLRRRRPNGPTSTTPDLSLKGHRQGRRFAGHRADGRHRREL